MGHDGPAHQRIPLGFGGLAGARGDHIGHFYGTRQEWGAIVVPFLKTGLDAGDKCVFNINPEPEGDELRAELAATGVDVDAVLASGQLVLTEGRPSVEGMRATLIAALAEIPDKYPFLRWGGDMTWSFTRIPDTRTLMEWECACNVLEDPPCVFLCQYDLTRFPGTVVVDAMRTHPVCVIGSGLHQNPYYERPEQFLEGLRDRS